MGVCYVPVFIYSGWAQYHEPLYCALPYSRPYMNNKGKKNNHTNSNWNICCGESTRLRHSAQHYKIHKNTICGRGIDFYVLYCAVYVVSTPLLILYTHYYIMIILASVVEEAFRPFPKIKVPIPRCENTPLQVKALRSKPYWAKSVSVVEQTSILRSQNS